MSTIITIITIALEALPCPKLVRSLILYEVYTVFILGFFWVYIGVILGLCWGSLGARLKRQACPFRASRGPPC